MDVAKDHVAVMPGVRPGHHGIVAHRHKTSFDRAGVEHLYAREVFSSIYAFDPRRVVVAQDQVFLPLQSFQGRPNRRRTEEEVAEDPHVVLVRHLVIPFRQHHLVHLCGRLERTVAVLDDVRMSEMLAAASRHFANCG